MKIGQNIKKLRKEKNITQKQLAELIDVSTITIQKYESNSRTPPLDKLEKIAEKLNVTLKELLTTSVNINGITVHIQEEVCLVDECAGLNECACSNDNENTSKYTNSIYTAEELTLYSEMKDDLDSTSKNLNLFKQLLINLKLNEELMENDYLTLLDSTKAFLEFEIYKLKKGRD